MKHGYWTVLKWVWVALLIALSGCASQLKIDRTHTSKSQDSRVQFLVLHYTWGDFPVSLKTLTDGAVSSHYLVRDEPADVFQLVDENRRAFHAGVSSWQGNTGLNASSIGIEIVNLGGRIDASGKMNFSEYPPAQVEAVVQLVKEIVKRHNIRGDRIVGHSDIAPTRKIDPGPKFPWKRLADEGLIPWPAASAVAQKLPQHVAKLPDVAWFQTKLARHGFLVTTTGEMDRLTKDVLVAFQMKYRPSSYNGVPDAETAALLDVLTSP